MKLKYRAVVFDWDGTLVDSTARIVESMQLAAADIKLPMRSAKEVQQIIGLGLPEAIMTLWPELLLGDARLQSMRERYNVHFIAPGRSTVAAFGFAIELLEILASAGVDVAVATGKSRSGLNQAFSELELGGFFCDSRCADETRSKPDPCMLNELLVALDVSPEAMLMVGDTDFDINMAHAAGVDAVAITHGAHDRQRLHASAPLAMVNDLPGLLAWLQESGLQVN